MLADELGATLTAAVAAGEYYLVVSCGNRVAVPGNEGYSKYGSIGGYRLSGTFIPLPKKAFIVSAPPPRIAVIRGKTLTLKVTALSNYKISYQWKKDGEDLPGKTASSLVLSNVQASAMGRYTVTLANIAGTVETDPCAVEVRYKPVFLTQPSPTLINAAVGDDITLVTESEGTAPVSLKWQKDKHDLTGNETATAPSLVLHDVDWFDGGVYACVASNGLGDTTSTPVKIVVSSPPIFTVQPRAFLPIAVGKTISIPSLAVGSDKISYQWYQGSTAIPGATKPTLSLAKASEAAHEGAAYHVTATNSVGMTESLASTVDVQIPPSVAIPPQTAFQSEAGATLALAVQSAGTPPLQHQWYLNKLPITGATGPSLDLSPLHWRNRGAYTCVVSNAVGSASSKTFNVDLTSAAVILTHPSDMKIARKGVGTLKAVGGGSPSLRYQWFKDGQPVSKATAANLTLTKASDATEGVYTVSVTNALSSTPAMSNPARVSVENAPLIAQAPASGYAPLGGTYRLQVTVDGSSSPPFKYQWYKGKLLLVGETADSLTLTNVTASAAGSYSVVVSNDVGKATPRAATLTVLEPPSIVSEPADLRRYEHDRVEISVVAKGSATLTYQWYKDGTTAMPQATKSTLTIEDVSIAQHPGYYHCIVSNRAAQVTSRAANLTLDPVPEPTVTTFNPGVGKAGERVRVNGTNLQWIKGAMFGTVKAAFVKGNSVEALLTIPAGAKTAPITIITHGGQKVYDADFKVAGGVTNDDFANAKLLFGSSLTVAGNNSGATPEFSEPDSEYVGTFFLAGMSVWYLWRCPYTASYLIDTTKTTLEHEIGVYSGGSLDALTNKEFGYRFTYPSGSFFWKGQFSFLATKGYDYYIRVDGVTTSDVWPHKGPFTFTMKPGKFVPLGAPTASSAESEKPSRVTLRTSFTPDAKSSQCFSWRARNRAGLPIVSLDFNGTDHSLSQQTGAEPPVGLDQVFLSGSEYDLEIVLDFAQHEWGILWNGVWIGERIQLPTGLTADDVGEVSPEWEIRDQAQPLSIKAAAVEVTSQPE